MEGTGRQFVRAAVVIALGAAGGLITSTVVASKAYQSRGEQVTKIEQTVTVTGSARKSIRSDLVVWQIRVEGDGTELKTAYSTLKAGLDRV